MLLRFIPENVLAVWDLVAPNLLDSLPLRVEQQHGAAVALLRSILTEDAVLWGWYRKVDDRPSEMRDVEALVLTGIQTDPILRTNSLIIYCFVTLAPQKSREAWQEGIETLKTYARAAKCVRIVTYTDRPEVANVMTHLGWQADFTQLTISL